MAEPRETSVVIPAFDEEAGIEAVVRGLAGRGILEVLVVDDGSCDATAARAEAAGARVVRHPYNKGESKVGEGSSFIIILPRLQEIPKAEA